MIKFSQHFLSKLEELIGETDYVLRYEKGSFKSGFCVLKESKVIVVNKYFPLEGKINSLVEIIKELEFDETGLSEKSSKLLHEIKTTQHSIF